MQDSKVEMTCQRYKYTIVIHALFILVCIHTYMQTDRQTDTYTYFYMYLYFNAYADTIKRS